MKYIIAFVLFLVLAVSPLLSNAVAQSAGEAVEHCEDLREEMPYDSGKQAYKAITQKAILKAVRKGFSEELDGFKSSLHNKRELTNVLKQLLGNYSIMNTTKNDIAFYPCVVLENVEVSLETRQMFNDMEIAEYCTARIELQKRLIKDTKYNFSKTLTNNISNYIPALEKNTVGSHDLPYKELANYVHTKGNTKKFNGITTVSCDKLYVSPIELFVRLTLDLVLNPNTFK